MAFDAVDVDRSGGLDTSELYVIVKEVSEMMNVSPPSADDLVEILKTIDEDHDGVVDKEEYH